MSTLDTISVGAKIPSFSAITTNGRIINSKELIGKNVVLYFYPKDDTPGCTQEGKDFSTHQASFSKLNCVIYGVSRDSIKSHEKFKEKYCFPFELISDEDETLCKLFEVIKMKNMYGKQVKGIERSTVLIDNSGKIRQIWRAVKVAGHVDAVLTELQALA